MARLYQGKVQIVGMAGLGDAVDMRAFVSRHGLQHIAHAVDADGHVWSALGVPGQPAWLFVDREGRVTSYLGVLHDERLRERLDRLAS